MLWAFLFAPSIGIVTYVLKGWGIDWNWILNGDQAMLLVVIAAVWKQISYNFLFFLAGLQSIPKSLIEAAAIDGAGPLRRFWTIVFPLLSPTTFFLLVVNIVYAFFDTFGVIDATTQGGPAQATKILVYKVYHDGVKAADLGGSSAQSVILMFIVIALTVVQFRFVEKQGAVLDGREPPLADVLLARGADPRRARRSRSRSTSPSSPRRCTLEEIMQVPMPLLPGRPAGARTTRRC